MPLRLTGLSPIIASLVLLSAISSDANARSAENQVESQQTFLPLECATFHSIGNMVVSISSGGVIGAINVTNIGADRDCLTGEVRALMVEFPKNSGMIQLHSAEFWIGAVVGNDTLVSGNGNGELYTSEYIGLNYIYRSTLDPDAPEFAGAVSEEDWVTAYTDSFTTLPWTSIDPMSRRRHVPLPVEVVEESYAWSYGYAEDFIIYNLSIRNIGNYVLQDMYFAIFVDPDPWYIGKQSGGQGTMLGYLQNYTTISPFTGCEITNSLNIAWSADNDGDPVNGKFTGPPVPGPGGGMIKPIPYVTGMRFLGIGGNAPLESYRESFNWWTAHYTGDPKYDFGPRRKEDFRSFGTGGLGSPRGDLNAYYMMSGQEIDYDQAYTAVIQPSDRTWFYPDREIALLAAMGWESRYLLSIGPITVPPGASVPVVFAYVGGENFHTDPNNIDNLPNDPDAYNANLDFSDLARNAMWASWIYDNPGVDTDGDGYYGKHRICILDSTLTDSGWVAVKADTTWYEGDGIPDWKAAGPPPAPIFWVEPTVNGLYVRFNGARTETARDLFTGLVDFEGYHIWLGRDDREQSYSLVASYDNENYDKFVWDAGLYPEANFVLHDIPYTVEQLRCLYGDPDDPCADSSFDPKSYTRTYPYYHPDFPESTFYFASHNHNASDFGLTSSITKVYPDEPPPLQNVHPDSLASDRYTEDGYLKYYDYEFTIQNLLPTVPYYVNVTTFDFGSPQEGLNPLETSKTVGDQFIYPYSSDGEMSGSDNRVYVYPNPYRIDADYRLAGYEGRTRESLPDNKVRAVHFANLPARCIIRVFSLDGDLVREIKHYRDTTDGDARDDEWNLVNRNRQLVVSGMYYWSVENLDSGETQMGKLVILM